MRGRRAQEAATKQRSLGVTASVGRDEKRAIELKPGSLHCCIQARFRHRSFPVEQQFSIARKRSRDNCVTIYEQTSKLFRPNPHAYCPRPGPGGWWHTRRHRHSRLPHTVNTYYHRACSKVNTIEQTNEEEARAISQEATRCPPWMVAILHETQHQQHRAPNHKNRQNKHKRVPLLVPWAASAFQAASAYPGA